LKRVDKMNLQELHEILQATGMPVAYSHFTESDTEPLPTPPFVVYLCTYSSHFHADSKVYKYIDNVQIELYTSKKDLDAESRIEEVLNDNEIPFQTIETYIESEQLFQKIYEVRLV
jgi:hypothetical protein